MQITACFFHSPPKQMLTKARSLPQYAVLLLSSCTTTINTKRKFLRGALKDLDLKVQHQMTYAAAKQYFVVT